MYIPQNILAQEWTFLLAYNSSFWHSKLASSTNQSHVSHLRFGILFCSHMTDSAFVSFRFFFIYSASQFWPWGADGSDPIGGIVNGSTASLVVFFVVGVESTFSDSSHCQSNSII